jgi:hypothetical protein
MVLRRGSGVFRSDDFGRPPPANNDNNTRSSDGINGRNTSDNDNANNSDNAAESNSNSDIDNDNDNARRLANMSLITDILNLSDEFSDAETSVHSDADADTATDNGSSVSPHSSSRRSSRRGSVNKLLENGNENENGVITVESTADEVLGGDTALTITDDTNVATSGAVISEIVREAEDGILGNEEEAFIEATSVVAYTESMTGQSKGC